MDLKHTIPTRKLLGMKAEDIVKELEKAGFDRERPITQAVDVKGFTGITFKQKGAGSDAEKNHSKEKL